MAHSPTSEPSGIWLPESQIGDENEMMLASLISLESAPSTSAPSAPSGPEALVGSSRQPWCATLQLSCLVIAPRSQ